MPKSISRCKNKHKGAPKHHTLESDLLSNIKETQFDVICANLPYIGTEKYTGVDVNVANYEPKKALQDQMG